jgi:hypothetical protein
MDEDRKGMEWWGKFCALPTFSFWRGPDNEPCRVMKVPDTCGDWVERRAMQDVADAAQAEINRLNSELEALRNRLKIRLVQEGK